MRDKEIKSFEERLSLYNKYKNELEELFANGNRINKVINDLHDKLQYGQVDFKDILDYYHLEYIVAQIDMLEGKGIVLNPHIVNYYKERFKNRLDQMLKEIDLCLKVWFLRELYYVLDNLNGTISEAEDECNEEEHSEYYEQFLDVDTNKFIKLMYYNKQEEFNKTYSDALIEKAETFYEGSSVEGYFQTIKYYLNSFKLNPQSRFNYLLNVSHNNGIMATKFIIHKDYQTQTLFYLLNDRDLLDYRMNNRTTDMAEKILMSLSKGLFTKYCDLELKKSLELNYECIA